MLLRSLVMAGGERGAESVAGFSRAWPSLALAAMACLLSACGTPPSPAERPCAEIGEELLPLLDARVSDVLEADSFRAGWQAARTWVEHQLVTHDEWVALGSCSLRDGQLGRAENAFTVASGRVRHSHDASVGLGHVALRSGRTSDAVARFCEALSLAPRSEDAFEGLELAVAGLPFGDPAAATAQRVLETRDAEGYQADRDRLLLAMAVRRNGGLGEFRRRPDRPAEGYTYEARVGIDYLEVRGDDGNWRSVFVQGVNLGPALPGNFASEAPEDERTWESWLSRISGLGANAVRVYTLQPPAFYRALARHNAGPAKQRLWLLQGVWVELPPEDDFDDPAFVDAFQAEIARVIDAVHGDLVLDPARGHARGIYAADVSRQTLAWIVGREWEPFAVAGYLARKPGQCGHAGRFVAISGGNAMECWIARMLDYTAGYEAAHHGVGRPVTFANWPTLDPLHHPTEATREEEDRLRHSLTGEPLPERSAPAWDDDAVTVNTALMSRGSDDTPGVFASYHVYPNFPYFMNLEPAYAAARDADGPLRYAGYLQALKQHHGQQPVLVAEFGMSTSRGIAHLQPEGLHHGGQDEAEAMRQTARLLGAIHAQRMAGGIAFEFMDEWFKGTWSTSPFELPEEHRPRWFNAESPEQSYGLFAARPATPVTIDGDARDWMALPVLASAPEGTDSPLGSIRATYDAGWVYLLLQPGKATNLDWSRTTLAVGIDTYSAERGERRLPAPADCATPTGVEFAMLLRGPGRSELLVTPAYLPRHPAVSGTAGVLASPLEPSGHFVPPSLETNRERYSRDGTRHEALQVAPGKLRFGSLDPGSPAFDTRSDVAVGPTGDIEVRLPWALLNFADPSSGRVLHSTAPSAGLGVTESHEIRFYACASVRAGTASPAALPPAVLPLQPWVMPAYRLEPKHGLPRLKEAFEALPPSPRPPESKLDLRS